MAVGETVCGACLYEPYFWRFRSIIDQLDLTLGSTFVNFKVALVQLWLLYSIFRHERGLPWHGWPHSQWRGRCHKRGVTLASDTSLPPAAVPRRRKGLRCRAARGGVLSSSSSSSSSSLSSFFSLSGMGAGRGDRCVPATTAKLGTHWRKSSKHDTSYSR